MSQHKSALSSATYFLIGVNRLWALGANLVAVYVVSTHLTAIEQGYYYAFQSLGASQFFFDLGVGFVLANVAGRRVAKAHLAGRSDLDALSTVLAFSLKWSLLSALILVGALHFAGSNLFPVAAQPVWNFYSVLVALNMVINTQLSIMEGVGRVLAVSVARALQSAVFVAVLFLGTLQGIGLQALPWALLVSTLPVLAWLIWTLGPSVLLKQSACETIRWHRDILPFQWRVAISWISGYFVFQAPVPFLYKVVGPTEAGQLGLSMQIFQALTTLASILLSIRIKTWARLAVQEQHHELRSDLWRIARWGIGAVMVGAAVLMMLRWLLFQLSPMHVERVVDTQAWLLLTLAAAANQLFFSLNYYFRAQGQEPLWTIAAAAGLTAVLAAWLTSSFASIAIVVVAYSSISLVIHAGGSLIIYRALARK